MNPLLYEGMESMILRKYKPEDCAVLADLFYHTVHTINRRDYSEEQLDVWATGTVDLEQWNQSFMEHHTVVAEIDGIIVGFGDMDRTGYLDRLYVHKDYQNQGIATAICNVLEQAVRIPRIVTHVSMTAKGFFEGRGYRVIRVQQVERQGIMLTNYVMERTCADVTEDRE